VAREGKREGGGRGVLGAAEGRKPGYNWLFLIPKISKTRTQHARSFDPPESGGAHDPCFLQVLFSVLGEHPHHSEREAGWLLHCTRYPDRMGDGDLGPTLGDVSLVNLILEVAMRL